MLRETCLTELRYVRTSHDWRVFVGQAHRRALGYWLWLPPAALLAGMIALTEFLRPLGSEQVAFNAIIGMAILQSVIFIAFQRFTAHRYVSEANGAVLGERVLELTESGLEDRGRNSNATYVWAGIDEISSSGSIVVFWTDPGGGIFLPKAAFASNDALDQFLQLARARLSASR